ncbi:MAG: hypothetical protein KDI11_00450, partial [Alphaproteobacteria bacterium]|nr:hypothetical protein [Alphaproteobacteria bacterium]
EKIKNILKDILKDLVTEDALQSTLENDNQTLLKTLKEQYPDGKIQADRLQILAKKIHLASEREKYAIENSLRILEKIKGEPGPALEPLKKEAEKQQPDAECDEPLAPHEEFCQNARQKLFNEDGTLQEEFLAKAAEAAGMPAKRLRQICNSGENARLRPNESWETLSEALSSFEA